MMNSRFLMSCHAVLKVVLFQEIFFCLKPNIIDDIPRILNDGDAFSRLNILRFELII